MRTKVSTYDVMGKRCDRRCGAVKSLANRLTSARALVTRLHENRDSAGSQKKNYFFFLNNKKNGGAVEEMILLFVKR